MSDLVERLRSLNPWHDLGWPEVLRGAATEIEALRRENQELRKALEAITDRSRNGELGTSKVIDMRNIADRALTMSDIHREQHEGLCPRPCNDRPSDFSMRDCIEAGECGCIAFPTRAAEHELRAERDNLLNEVSSFRSSFREQLDRPRREAE